MKKEYVKRVMCLLMAVTVSCGLIACAADTEPEETKQQTENSQSTVKQTEPKSEPTTEPVPKQMGKYTLDECLVSNGVYIGYDDGTYDKFPGGGWCQGVSSSKHTFGGMFLRDSKGKYGGSVNSESNIIVCSEYDFSLSLHKVYAEARAFSLETTESITGYGIIQNIYEEQDNCVNVHIYYENGGRNMSNPPYINGKPASEYEYVEHKWTYTLPKAQEQVHYTLYGFKDEDTITFGEYVGTKYEELKLNIDTTYYHCITSSLNWDTEVTYFPTTTPTQEGYAVVDLSDVPDGKYVMLFRYNGKYRATVINIES